MKKTIIYRISIIIWILTVPSVFPADAVIKLSAKNREHQISRHLFGANLEYHLYSDAMCESADFQRLLKRMNISFLRYPGGEVTSHYHWKQPSGHGFDPVSDQWSPEFKGTLVPAEKWLDFDEYIKLCRATGCEPLVGVNLESGHAYNRTEEGIAEAAEWVRYAKEKGYNIKYWFLDNESYGPWGTYDYKSFPDRPKPMTAKEYGNLCRLYGEEMRKVDPSIKLIANWAFEEKEAKYSGIWKDLIDEAGKYFDYIDFHFYWKWNSANWETWLKTVHMEHYNTGSLSYADFIRQVKKYIADKRLNVKVCSFEWNLFNNQDISTYPGKYKMSLITAQQLMEFIQGGLDASCFWPLDWAENHEKAAIRCLINRDTMRLNPQGEMFSFFNDVSDGWYIPVSSSDENVIAVASIHDLQPWIETKGLRKRPKIQIYLLRKSAEPADITLTVEKLDAFSARADSFHALNNKLDEDECEIAAVPIVMKKSVTDTTVKISLAPWTITRIILQ